MTRRFSAMLNACRWCGEKGEVQRNQSHYEMAEQVRATCPRVCKPIYLERSFHHGMPLAHYYNDLFGGLRALAQVWNDEHDGPGFFAGLA